jgi:nucleoside phosphorylase
MHASKRTPMMGQIRTHNIVVAVMPAIDNSRAALMQLLNDFQSIRSGLLAGIGGGVPGKEDDISLDDVVVSKATATIRHGKGHGG